MRIQSTKKTYKFVLSQAITLKCCTNNAWG